MRAFSYPECQKTPFGPAAAYLLFLSLAREVEPSRVEIVERSSVTPFAVNEPTGRSRHKE
jgi:hypothetical protein